MTGSRIVSFFGSDMLNARARPTIYIYSSEHVRLTVLILFQIRCACVCVCVRVGQKNERCFFTVFFFSAGCFISFQPELSWKEIDRRPVGQTSRIFNFIITLSCT